MLGICGLVFTSFLSFKIQLTQIYGSNSIHVYHRKSENMPLLPNLKHTHLNIKKNPPNKELILFPKKKIITEKK